jgi:hypothetical protein
MLAAKREPRILVAYGSGVLATAVERRLGSTAKVELVPVAGLARRVRLRLRLHLGGQCDAVVTDPFLTELERRRVRDAVASVPRPPALVHIRAAAGEVEADVESWGERESADLLEDVVAALTR